MTSVPANRCIVFAALTAVGCAVDLATKAWMFSRPELRGGAASWLWTGHVGFQLSLNEGALWGLGQGNAWLFATLSAAAAVAIPVWLFWFRAARDLWLTVALGLVMGGVLGNLYDRLGLPGLVRPSTNQLTDQRVFAVRDWILVQWNDRWRWPNFNVADSLLVVGAALLVWHAFGARQADRLSES
jgi:signal peptidase II